MGTVTGVPIPADIPTTPLPPREQPQPWPGWTGVRHHEDHSTCRDSRGTATDREGAKQS